MKDRPAIRVVALLLLTSLALAPHPARAWGTEGHAVVALIARSYLTPVARARVDALLAADPDTLTGRDMAARAAWADAWRAAGHPETSKWHYVNLEVGHPDLREACAGLPPSVHPASAGPADDCIVGRIRAFEAELADPATSQPERILALKYLLHFVGDLHQPLHAADRQDRGGNCVLLALGGPRSVNLHSYWDTVVVSELGNDANTIATKLRAAITPGQTSAWSKGDPASWALEGVAVAQAKVYFPEAPVGCGDRAPVALPAGYDAEAQRVATVQLQKAGVRLAAVLNRALSPR